MPKFRPSLIFFFALLSYGCNSLSDSDNAAKPGAVNHPGGTFVWHDLITHDIDTARQFYSGLFGWEFENAGDREGAPYLLAKLNGRYAGGILQMKRPVDGSTFSRWLGYMTVEDIETALATAYSAGGTVWESSRDMGEMGKVAAIQDSQSAALGLIETHFDASGLILHETEGAIVWDELLTADSDKAAAFYTQLADYKINTIERRDGEYTLLENNGIPRAGIMQNPFDATDPIWLSYFAVSDPMAVVEKTRALGGTVLFAPSPDIREGTIALIQDPDGAVLALQKWPL